MGTLSATGTARATCVAVDSVSKTEWDDAVASFADGVFDQTWAYGAACWGEGNLSHLIVTRDNALVAASQVVLLKPPLLDKGIAHVKFGPLWRPRGAPLDLMLLEQILSDLRDEYVTRRGLYLRVMPPAPTTDAARLSAPFASVGFARRDLPDATRYLVDLAQPLARLRAGLKSKWRYHLKKAAQQDLDVVHGDDADTLDEFLGLYAAMRLRKDFADTAALKRLPTILADLPPALRLSIWICRQGEVPLAGAVVSALGATALYLFGATNDRGRDLRAGYRLHWAIIAWLQDAGCRWYDLGGGCDNPGLIQFKSGLVGKTGQTPALPGYFDLSGGALSTLIAKSVFGLRDHFGSARERLTRKRRPRER